MTVFKSSFSEFYSFTIFVQRGTIVLQNGFKKIESLQMNLKDNITRCYEKKKKKGIKQAKLFEKKNGNKVMTDSTQIKYQNQYLGFVSMVTHSNQMRY